jgi:hypothetical protein
MAENTIPPQRANRWKRSALHRHSRRAALRFDQQQVLEHSLKYQYLLQAARLRLNIPPGGFMSGVSSGAAARSAWAACARWLDALAELDFYRRLPQLRKRASGMSNEEILHLVCQAVPTPPAGGALTGELDGIRRAMGLSCSWLFLVMTDLLYGSHYRIYFHPASVTVVHHPDFPPEQGRILLAVDYDATMDDIEHVFPIIQEEQDSIPLKSALPRKPMEQHELVRYARWYARRCQGLSALEIARHPDECAGFRDTYGHDPEDYAAREDVVSIVSNGIATFCRQTGRSIP